MYLHTCIYIYGTKTVILDALMQLGFTIHSLNRSWYNMCICIYIHIYTYMVQKQLDIHDSGCTYAVKIHSRFVEQKLVQYVYMCLCTYIYIYGTKQLQIHDSGCIYSIRIHSRFVESLPARGNTYNIWINVCVCIYLNITILYICIYVYVHI